MRLRYLVLSAIFLVLALPLRADTTYTYTGNAFANFNDAPSPQTNFTTADSITGTFTVATPLVANQPMTTVNWLTFSFSDGLDTYTDQSSGLLIDYLAVATDASGNITNWGFAFYTDNDWFTSQDVTSNFFATQGQFELEFTGQPVDDGNHLDVDYGVVQAYNVSLPGTWTTTTDPTPTPEPSSLVLLGTGVLGAMGAVRRRFLS